MWLIVFHSRCYPRTLFFVHLSDVVCIVISVVVHGFRSSLAYYRLRHPFHFAGRDLCICNLTYLDFMADI